ncbi:golgin subfamily A member 3-like [Mauremys mutica]|uniref:golgin subfamily A member 3-like n=1 Tax=Mauremys mutica TaxID=74926 RepID=UPI001D151BE8|nr:golgin subfamily A member 3-like [Mauremys mutica]
MGTAASTEEKTVTRITERRGEKFPSDALSRLLRWGRRRGLSVKTVWERLGCELWKSVTQGDEEAFSLSPVWLTAQRRLEEFEAKNDTIQYLQNEKIVLEVALQAAKASKEELDEGVNFLGESTEAASEILAQLSQVENLQQENASLKKQTQKVKEQFLQQKVMVEAYRRDASSQDQLISELKSTKKRLDLEVKELKRELLKLQSEKQSIDVECSRLQKEVSQVHQQMVELESHLQSVQKERDDMEIQLQSLQIDKEQITSLAEVNEVLKLQVEHMQEEAKKAITEQKQKMKRLGLDLTSAQKEMKAKHKAYENAVGILSRRLQEALTAKESSELELSKLKAQIADGGNNQASHERIQALEIELQAVSHSKMMSEKELQEVISLTSQELQESRGFRRKIKRLEDINKKLALELEHERGKLTGLGQSNTVLREYSNTPETVLAEREADLVQLNLRVQAVLNIQALQTALEREKSKVNNLKKQVAAAKVDAAHNHRHYRTAVLELSEIKKELQAKELLVQTLQVEADKLQTIIERAHASFKALLLKQKGGICSERADALDKTPAARLLKALHAEAIPSESQSHAQPAPPEEQAADPSSEAVVQGLSSSSSPDEAVAGAATKEPPPIDVKAHQDLLCRVATAMALPVEEVQEDEDPITNVVGADMLVRVALPFVRTVQRNATTIWQTPASVPPTARGVEQKYSVPPTGYEYLYTHPTPDSLVVQSVNDRERHGQPAPAPKSKDARRMDLLGRKRGEFLSFAL